MGMSNIIKHGGKSHVVNVSHSDGYVDFRHYTMKKSYLTIKVWNSLKFFVKVIVPFTFFLIALWTPTTSEPDKAIVSFVIIPAIFLALPLVFVNEFANNRIADIRGNPVPEGLETIHGKYISKGWKVIGTKETSVVIGKIAPPGDFATMVRLGLDSSHATDIVDALEMLENPTIRTNHTMSQKLLKAMYKVGEAEEKRIVDSVDSAVEEINTRLDTHD